MNQANYFPSIYIFFLHRKFTRFQTKSLQSLGTYISGRTWDCSQKSHYKIFDRTTGCIEIWGNLCKPFDWENIYAQTKRIKTSRYPNFKK